MASKQTHAKPFTHKGTGGQKPVLDIKPFVHAGNQVTPNDSNVTQSKTIHGSGEQGNRLKTAHGPPPNRPPRENQVAPPRGPPRRPQPTPAPKAGASGVHAERERSEPPPRQGYRHATSVDVGTGKLAGRVIGRKYGPIGCGAAWQDPPILAAPLWITTDVIARMGAMRTTGSEASMHYPVRVGTNAAKGYLCLRHMRSSKRRSKN